MERISLAVAHDHVESLTKFQKPIIPIEELIWNGLDADATVIEVVFTDNGLNGLTAIRVVDNGHGIHNRDCARAFGSLGGSNKLNSQRSPLGRVHHGRSGKGRFRAFGLGQSVLWTSRYADGPHTFEYTIEGNRLNLRDFVIGEPVPSGTGETGVSVEIRGIDKNHPSLRGHDGAIELSRLALYLRKYPNTRIRYDGEEVDPDKAIERETRYKLSIPASASEASEALEADLTVVEWKEKVERALYLCDGDGFTRFERPPGIQAPGYSFTAYVRSPFVNELDEQDAFALGELHPGLNSLVELSKDWLRAHFRQRDAERAADLVREWKKEKVYPYTEQPTGPLETAEREVFDVCALKVNEYLPGFARFEPSGKKLTFRLIREALNSNPDGLQTILREVLSLPQEQQQELASILEKTSLSAILNASRVVMDRLAFLGGLDDLLFGNFKTRLLERQQLQRILVNELWIFGEQYALGVDDESLRRLLHKHVEILGRDDLAGNDEVNDLDGRKRIIDLMLYRRYPQNLQGHYEHLVIELKRPNRTIGKEEISQIEEYAFAVSADERFDKVKTCWNFVLIGNELSPLADQKCRVRGREYGHIHESEDAGVNIRVRVWSDIIEQAKWRYEFFRKQLEYQIGSSDGLEYLRKKYPHLIPSTAPEPQPSPP